MSRAGKGPGEPGRPRKAPDKLRSNRVRVRFSPRELTFIRQNCEGTALPELIRELLLVRLRAERRRGIPLENRKTMGQLSKVSNNINQLARLARAGRLPAHLEPLLRRLHKGLVEYRQALTRERG